MQVLHNHFLDKPTILIHDRIINGCVDCTIDELDEVAKEHEVPSSFIEEVKSVYTGVSTPEQVQLFANSSVWQVREAVARHGTDEQRQELINDPSYWVSEAAAERMYELEQQVKKNEEAASELS